MPLVTLITVVRNDYEGLLRTLASVVAQSFRDFQFVVVDGGSTDGTADLIRQTSSVDTWISEPDAGIYHAMNKGVALADGEWLLFMNAGDAFADADALSVAVASIGSAVDVVYADWIYLEDGALARASHARMNVRHQSVLYRKSLHETFGLYVVGKEVTISDFVFFLAIADCRWVRCARPISICDRSGVSSRPPHFHQRMAAELMFGRRSRVVVALILLLHPLYRFLKRRVLGKR